MGSIRGEKTIEIEAAIDRVYQIAADIEKAPDWQESLKDVEVLARDAEGRPTLVETVSDARVKDVRARLRFSYDPPSGLNWTQEKGDAKALDGWWRLEDLGDGRTRAVYGLEADPGRILGLLLRGPVEGRVRDFLLGSAAEGLRDRAERG